jgi:hypothetical protein
MFFTIRSVSYNGVRYLTMEVSYDGGILRWRYLTMEVSYDGGILRWRQRCQAQFDFAQRRHIILHNQRQIVA